ncbi:MAG TPA: MBL fold metallo-hydrolase, partial [bacterium]|nr:MBL fold metallo-hydrolase [bacterium]
VPTVLAATAARYAVISVGRGNRYDLPSSAVVARWQASGARVFRTDESGAVLFATNGDSLRCLRP